MEHATIAFSEELQTVEEALKNEDIKKWEIVMQKKMIILLSTTLGH